MNIVRRRIPETEAGKNKIDAEVIAIRRAEVTVERETVTMLLRGRPAESGETPASQNAETELQVPKLPPAPENDPR
jgi:hypothetical protein